MAVKWTAVRRARFMKTVAAKKKGGAKKALAPKTRDTLIYLLHARKAAMTAVRGGAELSRAELYALLALDALKDAEN